MNRHLGNAMNIAWGPLQIFCTINLADNYSPIILHLYNGKDQVNEHAVSSGLTDLSMSRPSMPPLAIFSRKPWKTNGLWPFDKDGPRELQRFWVRFTAGRCPAIRLRSFCYVSVPTLRIHVSRINKLTEPIKAWQWLEKYLWMKYKRQWLADFVGSSEMNENIVEDVEGSWRFVTGFFVDPKRKTWQVAYLGQLVTPEFGLLRRVSTKVFRTP